MAIILTKVERQMPSVLSLHLTDEGSAAPRTPMTCPDSPTGELQTWELLLPSLLWPPHWEGGAGMSKVRFRKGRKRNKEISWEKLAIKLGLETWVKKIIPTQTSFLFLDTAGCQM